MIRLQEVIIAEITKGDGTTDDPCRVVMQIWTTDGKMLAEKDPHKEEKGNAKKQTPFFNNDALIESLKKK